MSDTFHDAVSFTPSTRDNAMLRAIAVVPLASSLNHCGEGLELNRTARKPFP